MPFLHYTTTLAEERPTLPTDRVQRIRKLFEIHTKLTEQYSIRYPEINGILAHARAWAEADPTPGEPTGQARLAIVDDVAQVRTDTVLFFNMTLARAEFLLNELIPGVFPTDEEEPLQSVDIDEIFQLGAGIAVLGAAITAAGGAPVGVPVAAFGGGMMIGAAIGGMLWD